MKKALLIICSLAVISLTSCKDAIEAPPNGNNYIPQPFTIDTTWIYSLNSFDTTGAISSTKMDTLSIDSVSVTDTKKRITFNDGTAVILDTNGSWWVMVKYHPNMCDCTMINIPATLYDTIFTAENIPVKVAGKVGSGKVYAYIKDINQSISVPAGTFTCFVFEVDAIIPDALLTSKALVYISPTVGVVQQDLYESDPVTHQLYLVSRSQLTRLK